MDKAFVQPTPRKAIAEHKDGANGFHRRPHPPPATMPAEGVVHTITFSCSIDVNVLVDNTDPPSFSAKP
jgi:hypothetical protein